MTSTRDWTVSVIDSKFGKGIFSFKKEKFSSSENEETTQMKISKTYDLSLSNPLQNLKAAELWSIYRLDDYRYARAVLEVLWLNETTQNDISLNIIFGDENFSAPRDLIFNSLKKHLLTSESPTILSDVSPVIEPNSELIHSLTNLPFVKDLSTLFDSFKNRLLLFENNIPILEQIYKDPQIQIEATCSIYFLENFIKNDKLLDILQLKIKSRYIIEGPGEETFKSVVDKLSQEQKQYVEKI